MVGVAGRSKACHTCRQRRIRCGAEKPSCGNCLKSGRSCAGYQRTQVFIPSHYTQSASCEATLSNTSLSQSQRGQGCLNRQHTIASLPQAISARNTTRDQFLANFIDRQLPSCILTSGHLNDHRKWLLRLPDIASLTPAMEYAILALSTTALEQDSDFGYYGKCPSLKLYTRGLYELQKAIDGPKTRLNDQTLAACVLLGMFEFSECPGKTVSAYMRHYQGAMALLQIRGPEQHIGGLAHDVFQVLRMHTAFQGLSQNSGSQLAKSAWTEGPWMSKSKNMHDRLLDIFLQVPRLLTRDRAVIYPQPSRSSLTAGLKALNALLALNGELNKWFESYQCTYPTLYWPELSTASSSTDKEELGRLYPVSFQFPSYHIAETMILYWTVQILIHATICSLSSKLPFSEIKEMTTLEVDNHVSLADTEQRIETSDFVSWPEISARYICQSVDYFFREEFRGMGAGVVLSPLLVVKACLSRSVGLSSREIVWIDETIGRIQGNGAGLAACV